MKSPVSVHNLSPDVSPSAESSPNPLLPNLIAGAIVGLVALIYSISSAALLFSGALSPYLPQGAKLALLGSITLGVMMALLSQFPFTVAGSETKSAVVLGGMMAAIAQRMGPDNPALWSTLQGAIAVTTLIRAEPVFAEAISAGATGPLYSLPSDR